MGAREKEDAVYLRLDIKNLEQKNFVLVYSKGTHQDSYPKKIALVDKQTHQHVNIALQRHLDRKSTIIYIYCKSCIINLTSFNFNYYSEHSSPQNQLPGQDALYDKKILVIRKSVKTLVVAPKKCPSQHSSPINLTNFDASYLSLSAHLLGEQVQTDPPTMSQLELGVNIRYQLSVHDFNIYTKVIEITNKYIIHNKSHFPIEIRQFGFAPVVQLIAESQRYEFFWFDAKIKY